MCSSIKDHITVTAVCLLIGVQLSQGGFGELMIDDFLSSLNVYQRRHAIYACTYIQIRECIWVRTECRGSNNTTKRFFLPLRSAKLWRMRRIIDHAGMNSERRQPTWLGNETCLYTGNGLERVKTLNIPRILNHIYSCAALSQQWWSSSLCCTAEAPSSPPPFLKQSRLRK